MTDLVRDVIVGIVQDNESYFVPYCINRNWNKMYAIDKIKLGYILETNDWSFRCEKTMVNEKVYSIIIEFFGLLEKEIVLNYENEDIQVNSIQIFVTKDKMTKIKNGLFQETTDEFWKEF